MKSVIIKNKGESKTEFYLSALTFYIGKDKFQVIGIDNLGNGDHATYSIVFPDGSVQQRKHSYLVSQRHRITYVPV